MAHRYLLYPYLHLSDYLKAILGVCPHSFNIGLLDWWFRIGSAKRLEPHSLPIKQQPNISIDEYIIGQIQWSIDHARSLLRTTIIAKSSVESPQVHESKRLFTVHAHFLGQQTHKALVRRGT